MNDEHDSPSHPPPRRRCNNPQVRLLLRCHTLEKPITRDQVLAALAPFGWLPNEDNQTFIDAKTAETLQEMPDGVRDELTHTNPILVEGPAGTWGLCSMEKQHTVTFRMLNKFPSELQEFAQAVVSDFAERLEHLIGGPVTFPERIHIRKVDSEETVGSGAIDRRPEVRFVAFVREHRGRELRGMIAAVIMFLCLFAVSVIMFETWHSASGEYWRGWADRVSSAFLVAIITTSLALLFDFHRWRHRRNVITWAFGDVRFPPPD